jgi:hypothetical protein
MCDKCDTLIRIKVLLRIKYGLKGKCEHGIIVMFVMT